MLLAALVVSGCTTSRETSPKRTATEELLISSAADRAASHLNLKIPPDTKVFVDATNFDGPDGKYALSAIREDLVRKGAALVATRKQADMVVEVRSGALSIDNNKTLIGIPQFNIPLPLTTGEFTFPEIAFYKSHQRLAIAKFTAFAYNAKSGLYEGSTGPQYGFSHKTKWTILVFVSWERNNIMPKQTSPSPYNIEAPELP